MRRARFVLLAGLIFAFSAMAQEPAHSGESEQGDPWLVWKWANFAILAIGLGYLIGKNVPPLFRARTEEIQKGIADAGKMKRDAEAEASALDQRFAGLAAEIERLRTDAAQQTSAEGNRIRKETDARLVKIQSQTAAEIALMTRAGRDELRRYAASLALDLAEQRVRTRVSQDTQDGLVDGFLQDLRHRVTQTGGRV